MYKKHNALFSLGFSLLSFSSYSMNTKTQNEKQVGELRSQSATQTATHNSAQKASRKATYAKTENENNPFIRLSMKTFIRQIDFLMFDCKRECFNPKQSDNVWGEKENFKKALLKVEREKALPSDESDGKCKEYSFVDTDDIIYFWDSRIRLKQTVPPSKEFYDFIMREAAHPEQKKHANRNTCIIS